ncbi:MAG: 3-oxoacyl-[acyl-carrier-protein] reductase [Anaerolineae bacterium]|nr:3-oxoacyl-[acyl-carrier-protein] reductase [Anaerolineae bacterium]
MADRVAIVTGASRGIGRAIALALGQRGAKVVVNYVHSAEAAGAVVEELVRLGTDAQAVQADVSTQAGASSLVKACLDQYSTVDILVNNAGIARDQLSMRLKEEDWDAVLATDLKSAFLCAKAVQRTMLRKRWGRIISIGSVVGLTGNVGQANYAAAKAGLVGLTKTLARELGPRGITVNVVAPGFVETDMTAALDETLVSQARERIPLDRLGSPDDVAAAVAFLASDKAAYITGQVLCVDGGLAM